MKKVIREFECAMCGRCCASQDLVQVTSYELFRLADFLGMKPAAFFGRYCELTATNLNPAPHLYIKTAGGACPFLKDRKCSVHEARPYACKAYPMRVYWSPAVDTKAFVRSRYPALEETCSLFRIDDGDVLLGDHVLLARQTIAYWVDDAYFSMESGPADLSIPRRVADFYIHDEEMRETAKRYVVDPQYPPSAFGAEIAYAKISLTLQAAMWNLIPAEIRATGRIISEDERVGKYLLLTTDAGSVNAVRMLVDGSRLDRARTLGMASKSYPGKYVIAAIHGSSADGVAVGFSFDADRELLEELTANGTRPLYVFFTSGNPADGKLAGFPLNIKI